MRGVPRERLAISTAAVRLQADAEQPGRPAQHPLELRGVVEVDVRGEAEPVSQRAGEQTRPGGGSDQGEGRDLQRDGGGTRALADDDVDPEVLHREVEHLLGRAGHPVDLVEEQHLALGEAGQDGGQVSGVLDRGTAGDAHRLLELARDDHGQSRVVADQIVDRVRVAACHGQATALVEADPFHGHQAIRDKGLVEAVASRRPRREPRPSPPTSAPAQGTVRRRPGW